MVDAQRRGPVALQGVELHEAGVAFFAQRVTLQEAATVVDSGAIVALLFGDGACLFERAQITLVPLFAVAQNPVIIEALEQLTAVEVHRRLEQIQRSSGVFQRGRPL